MGLWTLAWCDGAVSRSQRIRMFKDWFDWTPNQKPATQTSLRDMTKSLRHLPAMPFRRIHRRSLQHSKFNFARLVVHERSLRGAVVQNAC